MKSKSKTKGFVWSLVPIALVSYAALLSGTIAFAQAVSFSPATNFLTQGTHPTSVAIANLNGDGKLDLAVANQGGGGVSILLNTITNMGLPAGVETSLIAPLNNINTNNKAAACGKLNAFINQVNEKTPPLTVAQASQLLQAANAIKASLGC